jgi:IclR family pca regulon transcriptional regulator
MNPKDWIAGVERGLKVLEAFDEGHSRLTAQQMADRTGLTRTAARRQLLTLTHLDYLATDGKLFWLTPRVLRLGQSFIDSSRLVRIVQPYLVRIAQGLQETAFLSVLDKNDVIYLARQGPSRANNAGYGIGERLPAPITAAGIMMLSYLSDTEQQTWLESYEIKNFTAFTIADKARLALEIKKPRNQGWALSEQQLNVHYRGIAVPILDHRGHLHGSLGVTPNIGHEDSDSAVKRVLPLLREAVQNIRNLI